MVYGVYSNSDLVHWSPAKIFQDEIKVRQLTRSSYNGVKVNYSHTNRSSVRSHKSTAFLGPLPISTEVILGPPFCRLRRNFGVSCDVDVHSHSTLKFDFSDISNTLNKGWKNAV